MKKIIVIMFLSLISINSIGQEIVSLKGIGINLPSLIGNTITVIGEKKIKTKFALTATTGVMLNNKLSGTIHKIGEWTSDHSNSGEFVSVGLRYAPRKKNNQNYFFAGSKFIFGYFLQSAKYQTPSEDWFKDHKVPDDYYFKDDRVYSDGFFFAFAFETGYDVEITKKFHLEIGLQGGYHLWTNKKQISEVSSILPGLGSMNVVGILVPKFIIEKSKKG